jgi:predicted carbohydrate-binding protein with CBM5 and CBM33 domain
VCNPIETPSEDKVADIIGKKTTAINEIFTSGIISQKIALKELRQLGDTTGMFTNITDEDIDNADDSTNPMGDMPYMGSEVNSYDTEEEYSEGFMGTKAKNRSYVQKGFATDHQGFRKKVRWIDRLKEYIKNHKKVC